MPIATLEKKSKTQTLKAQRPKVKNPKIKKPKIKSVELVMDMSKGPYQNNGASPWFSEIAVGTDYFGRPGLVMKICFDTGARFSWLTSTQCITDACMHTSEGDRGRFELKNSYSFNWLEHESKPLDFGPWGVMQANSGTDYIDILQATSDIYTGLLVNPLELVTDYSGAQFKELNWDGGFGVPTGFDRDDLTFHFVEQLVIQGLLAEDAVEISFFTDRATETGTIRIGDTAPESIADVDMSSEQTLPFEAHKGISKLGYIWTTPLTSLKVGDEPVTFDSVLGGDQSYFCLDTGASQLKGDSGAMIEAYTLIRNAMNTGSGSFPNLRFSFGTTFELVLTYSEYISSIEAGEDKDEEVVDIVALDGLPQLALIGSLMLDHIYTRYIYEKVGNEYLAKEMKIYNKIGGAVIIRDLTP